jgi:predicted nucleotidyltransferase
MAMRSQHMEEQQRAIDRLPQALRRAMEAAVQELVSASDPQRVILFGSFASGEANEDSDVDLLVVARTNNRWRLAAKLFLLWHDLRRRYPTLPAADIIVLTPRQFQKGSAVVGFIPYEAQRTGVTLYERPRKRTKVAGDCSVALRMVDSW